jgi:ABC-type Na+ efflux pump permease subunit
MFYIGVDDPQAYLDKVGQGVQESLDKQFENYELRGGTWAKLTRSKDERMADGSVIEYRNQDGNGLLKRGAARYQLLVPSYTVMFAFFLVMTVGWLFVSERRQGTLRRLQAAPLTRSQILLGKLLPCFLLSVLQGVLLLVAGKLVFGMRWGPESWSLGWQVLWLLPVVLTTSLAAMGMALLVASLAKTEIQVRCTERCRCWCWAGRRVCAAARDDAGVDAGIYPLTPQG